MKKNYLAPEAELLSFAAEDVITSSGGTLNNWTTPTIDLGTGSYTWENDDEELTFIQNS